MSKEFLIYFGHCNSHHERNVVDHRRASGLLDPLVAVVLFMVKPGIVFAHEIIAEVEGLVGFVLQSLWPFEGVNVFDLL